MLKIIVLFTIICVWNVYSENCTTVVKRSCGTTIANKMQGCLSGVNVRVTKTVCKMIECFKETETMIDTCPQLESVRAQVKGNIAQMQSVYVQYC
ncbi:Uncharacterised protein g7207 [Pycnogonum litorale]